jgi:hypothetical protein
MKHFLNQVFVILLFVCCFSFISSDNSALAASKENLVEKGNALFADGKYDEALTAYDKAAVDDPESPYILFNKGAALYKKESYADARDAFQKAALKSKDIDLEANARFNAGLCSFREGERQKDSDLNKTLEAYGASVTSFQEALDLDPRFSEAAENIEMVRLMMKSVLDEIKKQEEAAKKQQEQMQQTAEKIKQLIQKQEDLLNQSRTVLKNKSSQTTENRIPEDRTTEKGSEQNRAIAEAQDQLKQETADLSTELTQQPVPGAGPPANLQSASDHPSRQHLDYSAGEQESAVKQLTDNNTTAAAGHQQASLDALNKALDALAGDPQNQDSGQQNQSQQGQQSKAEKNSNPDNESKKSDAAKNQEPPEEDLEKEQAQAFELTDDPESILDEEKENKKYRSPISAGGFKEVDKDW